MIMKPLLLALVAGLAMFIAGCDSSTPPSEKGGSGSPSGRGAAPTETTVADNSAGQPADSSSAAPADFKVADDGVVRNAKGEAYCVVMNVPVDKATESEYPKVTKDGVTYIFCCESCPGMFAKDPAKYAVKK